MSNWDGRNIEVDFSFLGEGNFDSVIAVDGINADRYPSDYTIKKQTITNTSKMNITMAKGGGFLMVLRK